MKSGLEIKPLGWVAIIAGIGIAIYFAVKADKKQREVNQQDE